MLFFLSLFAMIVSLILVVGLHEAGHALAARCFGVKIKRVSIGFGKPLLCWKRKGGVEWVWGMWPVGGYVQLLNSRTQPVSPEEKPYCFDKKPIWIRIVILISGAVVNLFTAFTALIVLYMLGYQETLPVIAQVTSPSIATNAGLKATDRFIQINGHETASWHDVAQHFIMNVGTNNLTIITESSGANKKATLNVSQWRYNAQENALLGGMGIVPDFSIKQQVAGLSFFKSGCQAIKYIINEVIFFLVMLKQLVLGAIPFGVLLGPVGLFEAMIQSFMQGIAVFLMFISTLSIAVGLINLFPIPGLDGGSILYAAIEKYRGKPISVPLETLLHRLAFILFAVFLVNLVVNDLVRYAAKFSH